MPPLVCMQNSELRNEKYFNLLLLYILFFSLFLVVFFSIRIHILLVISSRSLIIIYLLNFLRGIILVERKVCLCVPTHDNNIYIYIWIAYHLVCPWFDPQRMLVCSRACVCVYVNAANVNWITFLLWQRKRTNCWCRYVLVLWFSPRYFYVFHSSMFATRTYAHAAQSYVENIWSFFFLFFYISPSQSNWNVCVCICNIGFDYAGTWKLLCL